VKYPEKGYAQGVLSAHILFPQVQVFFLLGILRHRLKVEDAERLPALCSSVSRGEDPV
jgi:hypothetical protein